MKNDLTWASRGPDSCRSQQLSRGQRKWGPWASRSSSLYRYIHINLNLYGISYRLSIMRITSFLSRMHLESAEVIRGWRRKKKSWFWQQHEAVLNSVQHTVSWGKEGGFTIFSWFIHFCLSRVGPVNIYSCYSDFIRINKRKICLEPLN